MLPVVGNAIPILLLLEGRLWLEPCCLGAWLLQLTDPMVLLLELDAAVDKPTVGFCNNVHSYVNLEILNNCRQETAIICLFVFEPQLLKDQELRFEKFVLSQ